MKRLREEPPQKTPTCPCRRDDETRHTLSHRPHPNVQSRQPPVLINTCHDAQFAPHVSANVNAGNTPPTLHPTGKGFAQCDMLQSWISVYAKNSELVLQHWSCKHLRDRLCQLAPFLKSLKSKKPHPTCGTDAWTLIFTQYPVQQLCDSIGTA